MKILIKNGRVIDPATGTDQVTDLLIEGERIVRIGSGPDMIADRVIRADGCFVMPGLIDLHVHLREPGYEYKETIETGTAAAAAGGFTTVCSMPNTSPAVDSPELIQWIKHKAEQISGVNVLPVGAVTKGQSGGEIIDVKAMASAGMCAMSEDGKSVMDEDLFKTAMEQAAAADLPVFAHCEDKDLAAEGVMNAGHRAQELGLAGITNQVEDIIVERDINLSRQTKAHLHLCHCSTYDSIRLLKEAKEEGLLVTAEVCPHHFVLTDEDIRTADTNFKMNPPLRSNRDKQALIKGLKDSVIDVIATDHAPHSEEDKNQPFATAPFGITGLETAVALTITHLIRPGIITPMQMAALMSWNPARILKTDKGTLNTGSVADVTIIDPLEEFEINAEQFVSKGKNSPFNKNRVFGRVKLTVASGNIIYVDRDGQEVKYDQ